MAKKRLIFTLLLSEGEIQLSRNFSLQKVGSLEWLYNNYSFNSIAYSIDELILLNVSRDKKNIVGFTESVKSLSEKCFMPIAAGGGIRSVDDGYEIIDAGADKLIVNSSLIENPNLVSSLVKIFGSQCIVMSIDYRYIKSRDIVYINNGTYSTERCVEAVINMAQQLGVGEIYLTSIDRDGTGQGYDLNMLAKAVKLCQMPIIASGGVGDFEHFIDGMKIPSVTGASTANVFNFVGDGLSEAREHICDAGISLAKWDFPSLIELD